MVQSDKNNEAWKQCLKNSRERDRVGCAKGKVLSDILVQKILKSLYLKSSPATDIYI